MKTVKEVSRLYGVSVRTLHHYDDIGLLQPQRSPTSGYRLYDDAQLFRLQQILIYKALEFPLQEIKRILNHQAFDADQTLEAQIECLEMKKEQIENLIDFAKKIKDKGVAAMEFTPFDQGQLDAYARQAKEKWADTEAYKEFTEKTKHKGDVEMQVLGSGLMDIFKKFTPFLETKESAEAVQALVGELQAYITAHFYTCTTEILKGLGKMYASHGDFQANIDRVAGEGVAEYVSKAIERFCATQSEQV